VAAVVLVILVATRSGAHPVKADSAGGRLSFLHLSPDAPALDIYLDGSRTIGGLQFGEASAYYGLTTGTHQLTVTAAGRLDPLLASPIAIQQGLSATIVLSGVVTAADLSPAAPAAAQFARYIQLGDDASSDTTQARLRVLQASPGSIALDVRVDGPTSAVLGSALSYGGLGVYTGLPPGSYTLTVSQSGSATPVAQIPGVTVAAGSAYTIVLGGVLAGVAAASAGPLQPFQAIRLADQTGGASQALTTGCNQVILPLAAGSPVSDVLPRLDDPTLVISIWRYDNASKTFRAGYFNDSNAPLDYTQTAASPEAAFICVSANTSWNPSS
jgi:hypothetical protein